MEESEKRLRIRDLTIELIDAYRFDQQKKIPSLLFELKKIAPESAEMHYFHGLDYYQNSENSLAILELQESVQKKPDFDPAWNLLGLAWGHAGKLDESLQAFLKAVEASPYNPTYIYNAAQAHHRLQNQDEALRLAKLAASIKTNFSDASRLIGKIHLASNNYDEAFLAFKEAYETGLRDREFLIQFTQVSSRAQKDKYVLMLLDELSPLKEEELIRLHATIRIKYGDFDKAADLLKSILQGKNKSREDLLLYLEAIHRSGGDAIEKAKEFRLSTPLEKELLDEIRSWEPLDQNTNLKDPIINPIR